MRDSKRDTDVKNSLLDSMGEGECEIIWESSVEMWILLYVKQIASPVLMHVTRCSGLVHSDDPGGWDEELGGRVVLDGELICAHVWFMLMYGKNHYNIVK